MTRKIRPGKVLTELVKGSLEYTRRLIARAFYQAFPDTENEWYFVAETFADYIIVEEYHLPIDEFYRVAYTIEGELVTFAPREEWEIVELAYQLKADQSMAEAKIEGWKPERYQGTRFELTERIDDGIELLEAKKGKTRRIKAIGQTAGVVNANGRRYPKAVVEAAVAEAKQNIANWSPGKTVLGEAEHPTDKGTRYANFLETVIKWTDIQFNDPSVELEGNLILTSKGQDAETLMEAGVIPGISLRGYGFSKTIEENGQQIEEVTELHYNGFDLVLEPADLNGRVTLFESQKRPQPKIEEAKSKMDELTLEALRAKYPQHVAQIEKERDETRRKELELALQERADADKRAEAAVKEREAKLREQLGIGPDDDLDKALQEREQERKRLLESQGKDDEELARLRAEQQQREVDQHIKAKLEELKKNYPADLMTILVDTINQLKPETVEAADALIEAKSKEYDQIMIKVKLAQQGMGGVQVIGPVIETETGIPEFARAAFTLTERMVERNLARNRDLRKAETPNEIFTRRYLAAFDRAYQTQLMREARELKEWEEAEATTDLNLPYSVSRVIVAEAFPELVALSVFDFGFEDMSPTRIYFEAYAAETGTQPAVTDESFTSSFDTYVQLSYRSIVPGTVTVTSDPAGTTYTEWDDFVLDYGEGKIMVLSTGAMADATGYLIDYTYDAVRLGENQAIKRGKGSLSYQTIEMRADRLASLITDEAITFSRTQLGWDATTRTLSMIVRELREMIDKRAIYLALASAHIAANNGGTWTSATDPIVELVEKLGVAKVAVMNDNYMPGFYLLSLTNADRLSNWDGFKRDGFPDAVMNSAGFVGRVKGLPVFQSPQMPDAKGLTGHRELVQHRVLTSKPMTIKGPFQARVSAASGSNSSLAAGQEYYAEEYNATVSLIEEKGGFVTVA